MNQTLADLAMGVLEELGPMEFTDAERAYAKIITDAFPEPVRVGLLESHGLPKRLLRESLTGEIFPPLDKDKVMPGSTDGEIFVVIRDGVKNTGMKPYGRKMTTHQIWDVVNYLRSMGPH